MVRGPDLDIIVLRRVAGGGAEQAAPAASDDLAPHVQVGKDRQQQKLAGQGQQSAANGLTPQPMAGGGGRFSGSASRRSAVT
ncbi:MAG: hypothetical protein QF511_08140 [Rhodospirillales bacterium]|nr:hypothetical protein [Rhodospirillales bacterium]MDP7215280.1 hypothetical protein [Rhodospirillales bacterium]HIJ43375.1 hypothetical protein [Rhodospirillaceae bacterium]HIJ93319.1 hypothetical protein [Rhodospirillaceae bacterium]